MNGSKIMNNGTTLSGGRSAGTRLGSYIGGFGGGRVLMLLRCRCERWLRVANLGLGSRCGTGERLRADVAVLDVRAGRQLLRWKRITYLQTRRHRHVAVIVLEQAVLAGRLVDERRRRHGDALAGRLEPPYLPFTSPVASFVSILNEPSAPSYPYVYEPSSFARPSVAESLENFFCPVNPPAVGRGASAGALTAGAGGFTLGAPPVGMKFE
uniref:Uncharacterized protein n=1 Tax=Anopheles farauti TaxID=69004 RepID=A0A182Q1E5_9DIPT